MELEDLSIVSMYHALDTDYNIKNTKQSPMPKASSLQELVYGIGRADALAELNKLAHAKVVSHLHHNEVIFTPNIKPAYAARPDVRKFARDTVRYLLLDLGFVVDNVCEERGGITPICTHVPLNVGKNKRRMRVFGPYMMFDARYMLSKPALLSAKTKKR